MYIWNHCILTLLDMSDFAPDARLRVARRARQDRAPVGRRVVALPVRARRRAARRFDERGGGVRGASGLRVSARVEEKNSAQVSVLALTSKYSRPHVLGRNVKTRHRVFPQSEHDREVHCSDLTVPLLRTFHRAVFLLGGKQHQLGDVLGPGAT